MNICKPTGSQYTMRKYVNILHSVYKNYSYRCNVYIYVISDLKKCNYIVYNYI